MPTYIGGVPSTAFGGVVCCSNCARVSLAHALTVHTVQGSCGGGFETDWYVSHAPHTHALHDPHPCLGPEYIGYSVVTTIQV